MATVPNDSGFALTVTDLLITIYDFAKVAENKENLLGVKPGSTEIAQSLSA